jgi:hypothetical protein
LIRHVDVRYHRSMIDRTSRQHKPTRSAPRVVSPLSYDQQSVRSAVADGLGYKRQRGAAGRASDPIDYRMHLGRPLSASGSGCAGVAQPKDQRTRARGADQRHRRLRLDRTNAAPNAGG